MDEVRIDSHAQSTYNALVFDDIIIFLLLSFSSQYQLSLYASFFLARVLVFL